MENASKALLMAAGVLIGMLIISLGVYLFINFGTSSSQIHANIETNQLNQFNSQFTSYVGKKNVTIHDVISMANLATQNNKEYKFARKDADGKDNYIDVFLNGQSIEYGYGDDQSTIEQNYNQRIEEQNNQITQASPNLKTYNVSVEISETTRRVYKVICTEN